MSEHNRAFVYSLGMHLTLFMLLFVVMRGEIPERKPLIIDFSFGDQPEVAQTAQPVNRAGNPSTAARTRRPISTKITEQLIAPVKAVTTQQEPRVQVMTETESQVTASTPGSLPVSALNSGAGVQRYGDDYRPDSSRSSSREMINADGPEMRYVKAHFASIRNTIINNLSYPRAARRKGWEGTVKVSFVVNEDGGVNNIRVLMTSGFEVLDSDAVETIRRCSPYPKPPRRAEMVMPVTYRLDD